MLYIVVTLDVSQFDNPVRDQVLALLPALENIFSILVTLEVSQPDKSRLKVVALEPAESNIHDISVTLEVFQPDKSRLKVVAV